MNCVTVSLLIQTNMPISAKQNARKKDEDWIPISNKGEIWCIFLNSLSYEHRAHAKIIRLLVNKLYTWKSNDNKNL